MASKKVYRTLNKLWLFKYFTVTLIITLHLNFALANETKDEGEGPQNVTATIENNSTIQKPMAEPLIRFRRQPPRTIVKHIIRPKHYKMKRVKRPKIKYSFAEPPPSFYSRKPTIIKKPTFDSSMFEDFSHMNVESADFDLPPSSYDSQSMDLDLYKHYEPSIEAASYKEIQKPPFYAYEAPEITYKEPSYTYNAPDIGSKHSVTYSYAPTKPRKPHTKYGVPTEFTYSTGYDRPSHNKYSYETPATKPIYTEIEKPYYNPPEKNEYLYKIPSIEVPRIPATTYGVPDVHIPTTGSNDYNKYSLVEQKPPYVSHAPNKAETYHFAEPPQPEPSVEITYSPSYEINIPSRGNYNSGHQPTLQYPSPPQYTQHSPPNYEQPSHQEPPKYEEPPQLYHPPINYQPTSNYESPTQENYEYDTASHQDVSGTNQPASYQPAPPPRHPHIDEYIPPSQDLPINVNQKQPSYDYPKSSYEVPIYDPIPFDASNQQEREIYPPQTFDQSNIQEQVDTNLSQAPPPSYPSEPTPALEASQPQPQPQDPHPPSDTRTETTVNRPKSPINHLGRIRKRKRPKGSSTTVSTTKHILDVPELEEAFEKENRNKNHNSREPDAHESQRFESIKNQNNIDDSYSKGPWNPMKVRTPSLTLMTTPRPNSAISTMSTKTKRYYNKHQRTITNATTTTTPKPAKVEILSIEKSRSKTYFDGAVSTPRIYKIDLFRNRFSLEHPSTSTTPQTHAKATDQTNFSKRTTQNAFDTTIFKSPLNNGGFHGNLPKNHKLF